MVEAAAAELARIGLDDALAILASFAQGPRRSLRSFGRTLDRPAVDRNASRLGDARIALALVERLPDCRDALRGLARRR